MNCSAQVQSTRSTVNGEIVHWEKIEGGCQNRTTSSPYICKRWVIVVEHDAKWNGMSMDGLKSPNGGGGERPRPFVVVAFWAGFVLAENRGNTVTRGQVSRGMFVLHSCWGLWAACT